MHTRTAIAHATTLVALLLSAVTPAQAAKVTVQYAPAAAIVLSEVSCQDDWVEIINTDLARPAKVGGMVITDGMPVTSDRGRRIAKNTVMARGGRLQITNLGFDIPCGVGHVVFTTASGVLRDEVTVPNLADGYTLSRTPSGWRASLPTPLGANVPAPNAFTYDRAGWMYDELHSYAIRITAEPTDLAKLVTTPKTYVPATFEMQGRDGVWLPTAGPITVGLRVKGNVGSRTSETAYGPGGLNIVEDKVSLKIKFNEYVKGQTFMGLKKLTLNNMAQDQTMTHEVLTYKLFRDAGLLAARTGFANVSINGALRGLFLNLEVYDDIAMAWHLDMQHVYEAEPLATSDPAVWINPDFLPSRVITDAFQVDEGDKKDRTDLRAVAAVFDTATATSADIHTYFDMTQVGTYLALEKFTNHFDGYAGSTYLAPKQYYVVTDKAGRITLAPAGTDQTWRASDIDTVGPNFTEPIETATGVLFQACQSDDACAAAFRRTLAWAAETVWDYKAYGDTLMVMHGDARRADPLRLPNEGDTAWAWLRMLDFFKSRPHDVDAYLATVVTGTLRWNPVSLVIPAGQPLTSAQLNAYSDVRAGFVYDIPLGVVLPVGRHTVKVTMYPASTSVPIATKAIEFTVQ